MVQVGRLRIIRDEIGAERGTRIGDGIGESPQIRGLIRDYVRAKVEAEIEVRRANASGVVAAARKNARDQAEAALTKAEKKLADALEAEINNAIPASDVSDSRGWVDPIIGFRGRYYLTDDTYLVARGDYGGFGVSSDVNYNLYGAIGKKLKENITMEIGIRHMGVEYENGGFSYDASFTGPFSAVMIHF